MKWKSVFKKNKMAANYITNIFDQFYQLTNSTCSLAIAPEVHLFYLTQLNF